MSMQRVLGLLLLVASVAVAASVWSIPLSDETVVHSLAAVCPLLAVLGMGMILLPSPLQERIDRGEDVWELSGLRKLTGRWWLVVFVGIAGAAGGYFLPIRNLDLANSHGIQAAQIDGAKK